MSANTNAVQGRLPCPFCGDEGEKGRQVISQMTGVLPPLENPHSYRTSANAHTRWEQENAEENRRRTTGVKNEFARLTCRVCGAMCPEANWNQRASVARVQPPPAGQLVATVELSDEQIEGEARLYSIDLASGLDWCFDDFNLKAFVRAMIAQSAAKVGA